MIRGLVRMKCYYVIIFSSKQLRYKYGLMAGSSPEGLLLFYVHELKVAGTVMFLILSLYSSLS